MLNVTNDGVTTLANDINSSATSIMVTDGSVFPVLAESDWFPLTLIKKDRVERMRVTARDGNDLTVVRGEENTSEQSWAGGDECRLSLTANAIADIQKSIPHRFGSLIYTLTKNLDAGESVITLGYHVLGDVGGGHYHVVLESDVPEHILIDGYGNHYLPNGNVLLLINRIPGEYCVHQYGAKGDVVLGQGTNDLPSIQAALAQTKIMAERQTTTEWHSMSGGCVVLGALNYGVLVTQDDVDAGMDCAIGVTRRTGFKGKGRNITTINCLDGFAAVPVVANARHATRGFDDFMEIGGFQILGRYYHGSNSNPSHGLKIDLSGGTGHRTDNFTRIYDIFVENVNGIGVFGRGRGETYWDNIQSNHSHWGFWLYELVDSYFSHCNAGGNWYSGFHNWKMSSSKFTECKSYFNGSSGTVNENSSNWWISGDSWVAGRSTYTQCESQEAHGSGFVILAGGNLFVNCVSADPKRVSIGANNARPAHSVCWYLGSQNGWIQSMSIDNHFQNCIATPNLTTNYSNLDAKSYLGDGAVYIESRSRANTGNILIAPRVYFDEIAIGGLGIGDNPLLSVMGEALKDSTPPSAATVVYKNELEGIRVYSTPIAERNHAVTDYLIQYTDGNEDIGENLWLDPTVSSLITGLTTDTTYTIDMEPVSRVGKGFVDTQIVTRLLTRQSATLTTGKGFSCNKPLIDLDAGVIKFSFTVGDRHNTTLQLQGLVYQGDGTTTELFISLYNEYSLRINVGGKQIDGLGAGKMFKNRKWDVVIYPTGIELYSNGIRESYHDSFVRGDARAGTGNVTHFGQPHPGGTATTNLEGSILAFSAGGTTIIFDNATGETQDVVEGDLSLVVSNVGLVDADWNEVPLVV